MFSWLKRNRIKNEKHKKKYINRFNEIKSKILDYKPLSDYDFNFIYHELSEYDKYELINIYDKTLTIIVTNYLEKE